MSLSTIDLVILIVYLGAMVGIGFWFAKKSSNTEEFMAAGRSLPGWAVGLSIFGTFVSSISFLANPGASYAGNWNPFVFGLSLPIAALIASKFFIPFYRSSGEVSAYSHLEHRFGPWARTYLVSLFLIMQLVRVGVIMMLAATPLNLMTGFDMQYIVIAIGIMVTLYTILGGIEAVIWTDVIQSIVLTGGAILCVFLIMFDMPEGPSQIIEIANQSGKFSLGEFSTDLTAKTFWITLLFGIFINLTNFGIDQSYVQRYITAKTDADAKRSVWIGAWLFIPTSALLFFIGTALFAYYQVKPELLEQASQKVAAFQSEQTGETIEATELNKDQMFPTFIAFQLPAGIKGLLIAAIFAAAMSSIDSSLNGSATLVLVDFYKRYKNPDATEKESMTVLYGTTLFLGVVGTGLGLVLIGHDNMLDIWWKLSGIFSGGMLGLFLLGMISKRAGSPAAVIGLVIGTVVILWMTLSGIHATLQDKTDSPFEFMRSFFEPIGPFTTSLHGYLTIVLGTVTIVVVGILCGSLFPKQQDKPE